MIYGFYVVSMWLQHGCFVIYICLPCTLYDVPMWLLCGFCVVDMQLFFVVAMCLICCCCVLPYAIWLQWLKHSFYMVAMLLVCCYYVVAIGFLFGLSVIDMWLLFGCHVMDMCLLGGC